MKLLLLKCPRCAHALAPGHDDVVMPCPNCGSAVRLDVDDLTLVEAHYATPGRVDAPQWAPFWVFGGRLYMKQRETQGGSGSATKESRQFWEEPRRFYVPAWRLELVEARDLAWGMLRDQTPLRPLTPSTEAAFLPAITSPEDARKLIELLIVSVEAGRKDWLKTLEYDLELGTPQFWLFPVEDRGEGRPERWRLLTG